MPDQIESCPRCGSIEDLHHGECGDPDHGGPSYVRCLDCDHVWGECFPDSQAVPLPAGMRDCVRCDGAGDLYGRGCPHCAGAGIHQT